MESGKKDTPDPQLDALLDALGAEGADAMLAELLKGEVGSTEEVATKPAEIRARLKELAGRRPELIVKIINHWLNEGRRKR